MLSFQRFGQGTPTCYHSCDHASLFFCIHLTFPPPPPLVFAQGAGLTLSFIAMKLLYSCFHVNIYFIFLPGRWARTSFRFECIWKTSPRGVGELHYDFLFLVHITI